MGTKQSTISTLILALPLVFLLNSFKVACLSPSLLKTKLQPFEPPHIRIVEFSTENFPGSKGNKVLTPTPNSELIFSENDIRETPRNKLLLECSAAFPIEWIYTGDGKPNFSMNISSVSNNIATSRKRGNSKIKSGVVLSYAALGLGGNLREMDTGNYSCQQVHQPSMATWIYIYVKGSSLFTNPESADLVIPAAVTESEESTLRIPCSVSFPSVSVNLQKSINGSLMPCSFPLTDEVTFQASKGYTLKSKNPCDLAGVYVCTASFNNTFQIVRYNVSTEESCYPNEVSTESESVESSPTELSVTIDSTVATETTEPPTMSTISGIEDPCDKKVCGPNALCRVINGEGVCRCFDDFTGDPYKVCKHISQAQTFTGLYSFFTKWQRGPPCKNPESVCGLNADCDGSSGFAVCKCASSFVGEPPYCRQKSCSVNDDCAEDQFCLSNRCEDSCSGACGTGAACTVKNHLPTCKCQPGFGGDPFTICCLPNAYGELPCSPKYCRRDSECSELKSCRTGRCKDPCEIDKDMCALNATCSVMDHRAVCSCPSGYFGDPYGLACERVPQPETPKPDSLSSAYVLTEELVSDELEAIPVQIPPLQPRVPLPSPTPSEFTNLCETSKPCGSGAECRMINSRAVCKCPHGLYGDPYQQCFEGIARHPLRPVLSSKKPLVTTSTVRSTLRPYRSPCDVTPSPCGLGSECRVINENVVCRCPPGTVGNPRKHCMPTFNDEETVVSPSSYLLTTIPLVSMGLEDNSVSSSPQPLPQTIGTFGLSPMMQYYSQTTKDHPCSPNPCGPFSVCKEIDGFPICSCRPGYAWIMTRCEPYETTGAPGNHITCLVNSDCQPEEECKAHECKPKKKKEEPALDICDPNPCGQHAICIIQKETGQAVCQCKDNRYGGVPPRCRPECLVDMDCANETQICSRRGECVTGSRSRII